MTQSAIEAESSKGTGSWPVQCPVDGRWLANGDSCPDCGSPLAPLRAVNELAAALLLEAATSTDSDTAIRLVSRAATLVPSTEPFEIAAADALERAGRPDLALVRVEAARSIAPRRVDLQERAAVLRGRQPANRGRRVPFASWSRLAVAAVAVLALGLAGGGLLGRSFTEPIEPGATPMQTSAALASADPATQSPAPSRNPVASMTPAPTSSISPAPTLEPARLVRAALTADLGLGTAELAVEQVGTTLRISGPVPDAAALADLEALVRRVVPDVAVDLSGVTFPTLQYVYIQPGDTLWSIASRMYGNPKRWRAIAAANPGVDPRRMQPGQRLILPTSTGRGSGL